MLTSAMIATSSQTVLQRRFLAERRQSRSQNPWNRVRCYIEVTGLVSIMIVLLVVTMSMNPPVCGYPLRLPAVRYAMLQPGALKEDAIQIAIMRNNIIYLGTEQTDFNNLDVKIRASMNPTTERKVYIRAEPRARYGTILAVLDRIRAAGISDVAFLVNEEPGQPSR